MLVHRPFWFLRHGETDWNAQGLSQGGIDIPLNALGLEQAERAADALSKHRFATIISSPLSRARVTAEIAAVRLGLPVELDPDLREVSFGDKEGHPVGDWYEDWINSTALPPNAEPFEALRARAVAAVNRATARPAPVLVVAHGFLFRALRSAMGLVANVRTPNATPLLCEPPTQGEAWTLTAEPGLEIQR